MLRTRRTVIVLLIIATFDNINCASVITEKEIGNNLRELKVRDDNATGYYLEARSRTKRWIEETVTPSGASVRINSPVGHSKRGVTSISNENQSSIPLSIDAHGLGHGEKKKEPVNEELYSYNISSTTFAENENTGDSKKYNEGDFDLEDFDQVDFGQVDFDQVDFDQVDFGQVDFDQENDETDQGETYEETELDMQTYSRHSSRGSGHSGGGHGHHSGGNHGHHSGRGHGRHSGSRHGQHTGHHKLHLSNVTMPNGMRASISVPEQLKGWKCGRPTLLINLDPHGKNGHREFKLVAKVVQSTKREHSSGHFKRYHFLKIQKVVNGCFWKRYRIRQTEIAAEAKNFNERLLFHGTNKVKDLLKSGFDERYSNINGMFGAGIYFAKHSSKSNQYAFGLNQPCPKHKNKNCDKCARQILLCRVTMGKVKKETGAAKIAHAPPGYHSVEGVATHKPGGLQYPEYIVYRGEQVYPEYLITYKIVK